MDRYINKDALIAEIKRRISVLEANKSVISMLAGGMFVNEFKDLLSFLDTLEVKEIGVDLGDPKGDIGVKTVWASSNSLEISRHGNSHNGENLEEAATKYAQDKYLPVQTAQSFKAGAQWQKEQMIDKACNFLHHYQEYPNHDIATGSLIEAFKMFIEL